MHEASELGDYLKTLSIAQISEGMHVSVELAKKTKKIIDEWSDGASNYAAMFSFRGDIYSGLQVNSLSYDDIEYANKHLLIISGLYGLLKPLDYIKPYRLEMGYRFNNGKYKSMYKFWGDKIANEINANQPVVDLTSIEYSKAVVPKLTNDICKPSFYTYNHKKQTYVSVAVHSKIARGAMANWIIKNRVKNFRSIYGFKELGYKINDQLSSEIAPVFYCEEFSGKGLSVRKES